MSCFPISDSPPQEFRQIADEFDRQKPCHIREDYYE